MSNFQPYIFRFMCGGAGVLLLFGWQKIHFKIYVKRSFFQNKQVEVFHHTLASNQIMSNLSQESARADS